MHDSSRSVIEEVWKEIPGFKFYEVSDLGVVRSKEKVKILSYKFGLSKGAINNAISGKSWKHL